MKNGESHFISQLAHLLLCKQAKFFCDLLHEGNEGLPRLIQLVLILLGKAKEGDTSREDTLIVARLKCIGNVLKECRPLFWVVKAANRDNASDILLLNQPIFTLVHLGHDVGANVVLVSFTENDITEARDRYFFSLLSIVVLPVVVDALTKLHSSSQTQIWINCGISGHFKKRGAVIIPLLGLDEELFGLLTQSGISTETSSE